MLIRAPLVGPPAYMSKEPSSGGWEVTFPTGVSNLAPGTACGDIVARMCCFWPGRSGGRGDGCPGPHSRLLMRQSVWSVSETRKMRWHPDFTDQWAVGERSQRCLERARKC